MKKRGKKDSLIGLIPVTLVIVGVVALFAFPTDKKIPEFKETSELSKYQYQAKNSNYRVQIGDKKTNTPTVEFTTSGKSISFAIKGITSEISDPEILENKLIYKDIEDGIDITYQTLSNGVKEEIILNKETNQNSFLFDMTTKGLEVDTESDHQGRMSFTDSKGNRMFHFENPFAIDAAGNRTDNAYYQIIEGENDKDQLLIIVDPEWLQSEEREYPIVIDPTILTDDNAPVGFWRFDEGYGTTANDHSPNSNAGTITNATWQTDDMCVSEKCLYFDGDDDYVNFGDVEVDGLATVTVSAWIRPTTITSSEPFHNTTGNAIIDKSGAGDDNLSLYLGSNDEIEFYIETSGEYTITTTTSPINTNVWTHVAGVYDGSDMYIYVNGEQITSGSASGSIIDNSNDLTVGTSDAQVADFDGFIDEVKVFDYALTASAVKAEHNTGATTHGSAAHFGPNNKDFLSDGLVGYWEMNETSENTCTGATNDNCDSSGNGNDGAWNADATSGNGKYGGGVELDGTGDFVDAGTDSLGGEITIATWINPDNIATNWAGFVSKNGTTDEKVFWLGQHSSDGYIRFGVYPDGNTESSIDTDSAVIANGSWYHIVATYDGNYQKLYVDGELVKTSSDLNTTQTSGTSNYWLGKSTAVGFDGTMDETRIFNKALSPTDVQNLYNWAPGPIAHWKLDENTGTTTTYDTSGGEHALTLASITESSWTKGRYGSALTLDGSADYASIADNDDFDFAAAAGFTIAGWFKHDTIATNADHIIGKRGLGGYSYKATITIDNTKVAANETDFPMVIADTYDGTSSEPDLRTTGNGGNIENTDATGGASGAYTVPADLIFTSDSNCTTKLDHEIEAYSASTGAIVAHVEIPSLSSSIDTVIYMCYGNYSVTASQEDVSGTWNSNYKGVWHFAETSGTFYDSTGNNNHGDDNVSDSGKTGKIGSGQQWDGINDYSDVGNGASLNNLGTMTLEVWAKDDGSSTQPPFIDKGHTDGWAFCGEDNQEASCFFVGFSGSYGRWRWSSPSGPDTSYTHMVLTYNSGSDANNPTLYKNAVDQVANVTETTSPSGTVDDDSSEGVRIGNKNDVTDRPWDGYLDEVRIIKQVKDGDYVTTAYNAQNSPTTFHSMGNETQTASQGYKIYMENDGDITFGIDDDGASFPEDTATTTTANYDDNLWHHFTAIKDGTTSITLYIDGTEVASDTSISSTGTLANANSLYIGIDDDGASNAFDGSLDDIRIYNYVRTTGQIVEDMNAGHPAPGSPVGSAVGWWQFDEGADNTCSGGTNDVCNFGAEGSNLDGTSTATRSNTGKIDKALDFNGTDDVVTITNDDSIDFGNGLSSEFTFSAWVNVDSDGEADSGQIYKKGATYTLETINESAGKVDLKGQVNLSTTNATLTIASALNIDQWHHVALTWADDDSQLSIYVDGIYKGSSTDGDGSLTDNANDLLIGGGTDKNFDGEIDEFKIYSSELDANQIKVEHNFGTQTVLGTTSTTSGGVGSFSAARKHCVPGDATSCNEAVAEWKFDANTGSTAVDTGGSGLNGILQGSLETTGWEYGKKGSALKLDGTNDFIEIADNSVLDFGSSDDFSIEGWFKHDTIATTEDIIIDKADFIDGYDKGDGADGAVTITASKNINTDTIDGGRSYADGIAYRVTAPADSAGSVTRYSGSDTISNGIAAGDEVLLINLQGTSSDFADVGNYEFMEVDSVTASTITFDTDITVSFNGTSAANQKVVVQRVPNYTSVTLSSSGALTASAWDGLTTTPTSTAGYYTGIVAFKATGIVTVGSGTSISVDGKGYRGGTGSAATATSSQGGEAFCGGVSVAGGAGGWSNPAAPQNGFNGSCGGGGGGGGYGFYNPPPEYTYDGNGGSGSGSYGGAGGGGGNGLSAVIGGSTQGGGGGGGGAGYGTAGGFGYSRWAYWNGTAGGTNTSGNGGNGYSGRYSSAGGGAGGGGTHGSADLSDIYLGGGGGGGGSGTDGDGIWDGGNGGDGGGIIFMSVGTLTNSGTVSADGNNGTAGETTNWGGGGGGGAAAGSIKILTSTSTLGTMTAEGGTGNTSEADGGDGGDGRIRIEYVNTPSGSSTPAASTLEIDGDSLGTGYVIQMESDGDITFGVDDDATWGPDDAATTTTADYDDNEWHHLTAIKDGTTSITLYIDGVEVASDTSMSATGTLENSGSLNIGGGITRWEGHLDNLKIYDYVRTPAQVAWTYNRGAPVGWWQFDECTGTTANDFSPNTNTGTITIGGSGSNTSAGTCSSGTGTEAWNNGTTGKLSASLDFDGTDDYITAPDSTDFVFKDMAVSFWIKPGTNGSYDSPVGQYDDGTGATGDWWNFERSSGTTISFKVDDSSTITSADSTTTLNVGTWYHVVGVRDEDSTLKLFINGKQETSVAETAYTIDSSQSVYIGNQYNNSRYFDGQIDDVRIYNYAMTSNQVRSLYSTGAVTFN
jgi:hypothetical protein